MIYEVNKGGNNLQHDMFFPTAKPDETECRCPRSYIKVDNAKLGSEKINYK